MLSPKATPASGRAGESGREQETESSDHGEAFKEMELPELRTLLFLCLHVCRMEDDFAVKSRSGREWSSRYFKPTTKIAFGRKSARRLDLRAVKPKPPSSQYFIDSWAKHGFMFWGKIGLAHRSCEIGGFFGRSMVLANSSFNACVQRNQKHVNQISFLGDTSLKTMGKVDWRNV